MNLLSRFFHLKHTPTQMPPTGRYMPPLIHTMRHFFASGAVFFRRSRLFFREAAFFSGGKGCEWGAQRATVGARGKKLKTRFQALSHLSSHARASALTSPPPDFLFSSIPLKPLKPPSHPTPSLQTSPNQAAAIKIALNERAVCGGQFFWGLRGGGI